MEKSDSDTVYQLPPKITIVTVQGAVPDMNISKLKM